MGNVSSIFKDRHIRGEGWDDYTRHMKDAEAHAERGNLKAALVAVGYASTLRDSDRPDELTRRALFRQVTDAARACQRSRVSYKMPGRHGRGWRNVRRSRSPTSS